MLLRPPLPLPFRRMLRPTRCNRLGPAFLSLLVLNLLAQAGPPASPLADPATFDRLVIDTLRDVHNIGADLYNTSRDYDGAYRLYHGALLTIRPLLSHRPSVQQRIEAGLLEAEREPTAAHKAFRLHVVIEDVRSELKKTAASPPADKNKPGDKPIPPRSTPDTPPPTPGTNTTKPQQPPPVKQTPIAPPPRLLKL